MKKEDTNKKQNNTEKWLNNWVNDKTTNDYPSEEELEKMIKLINPKEISTDKNTELPF